MKNRPPEWLELAEKYRELGTIEKAASAMGVSFSTARSRLVRMGVEINAKGHRSAESVLSGEECRKRRKELGLSQPALAKLAGITSVTISNFETGNRTPRPETQQKIADAFTHQIRGER